MSFSTTTIPSHGTVFAVDARPIPKVVYLPTVSTNPGRLVICKDYYGAARSSTITISTTGTDLLEDINWATFMRIPFMTMSFLSDGLRSWRVTGLYNSNLTSNFTPRQIGGLALWLDGTDPNANSVVPSNGSTISTWVDKSGSGNNATTFAGTILYSSNSLTFTGTQSMTTPLTSVMTSQSIFVITSANSSNKMDVMGPNVGDVISFNNGIQVIVTNYSQQVTRYGGTLIANGASVTQNANFLYGVSYISGGNSFVYFNGSQAGSNTTSATISGTATLMIGAYRDTVPKELYSGNISEIVLYSTIISITSRQQVEGYLAWKWGIQGSLPISHPYRFAPPS